MPASPGPAAAGAAGGDAGALGRGAIVNLVGGGVGRGLHLLTQVWIARRWGPTGFGAWALAWTVFRLAALLGPLGLHNAVLRFGGRFWPGSPGDVRAVAVAALRQAVLVAIALGLAVFALTPRLATGVFDSATAGRVLAILILALPFAAATRVGAAATRVTRRMHYAISLEELGQPALFLVASLALGWRGASLEALALAAGLTFVAAGVASVATVARLFPAAAPSEPPPAPRELLRYALPTAAAGTLGVLLPWLDRLFVGAFYGDAEVGLYYAASQASLVVVLVLTGFNGIVAPMISALQTPDGRDRLERVFRVATRWGVLASTPLVVTIVWAAGDLLAATFGAPYAEAGPALVILGLGQAVNAATGAVGYLLMMGGRQTVWLRLALLAVGLDVALNLWWIPVWGLEGAAAATAVAVAVLFGGGLASVRRLLRVRPYAEGWRSLASIVAVALAVGAVAARAAGGWPPWASAAAVLAASTIAVAVGWWLTRDDADRELLASLGSAVGR